MDKAVVEIEGLPVHVGQILSYQSPIFRQLSTTEDFCQLARQIRGPFSIIVRREKEITAITDFAGNYPIYWIKEPGTASTHVGSRVADLIRYSCRKLSLPAAHWWILHRGIGPHCLYADINVVPPASVWRVSEGTQIQVSQYIDWGAIANEEPTTFKDARAQFIQIATEYISAVAKPHNRLACFLSSGTDSVIVAHLAKCAGVEVVSLTADYLFKRYSEFDSAANIAKTLGIEHHRVPVGYWNNRQALYRMNTKIMDGPASQSQLAILGALGDAALNLGIERCLWGDRVGSLFMEFDYYFRGLPAETHAFEKACRGMNLSNYLSCVGNVGTSDELMNELVDALRINLEEFNDYVNQCNEDYRKEHSCLFETFGYPLARQIADQKNAGIWHQSCSLPAQRGIGGNSQILCPFLDIEMIRFALSLPVAFKYRDGVGKWFLKEFLRRETGLTLAKRASPNPSRVWWWIPRVDDLLFIDPRLRRLVVSLETSNVLKNGALYKNMFDVTALGIWLNRHRLR